MNKIVKKIINVSCAIAFVFCMVMIIWDIITATDYTPFIEKPGGIPTLIIMALVAVWFAFNIRKEKNGQ